MSKNPETVEPTLSEKQRAEWADLVKPWYEFAKSRDSGLVGQARLVVAVAERLSYLESSTTALRAALAQARAEQQRVETALAEALRQLWQAKEEQRRLEEALHALRATILIGSCYECGIGEQYRQGLQLCERCAGMLDGIDVALASPDAPTREASGE